jgi:DNA-binding LytR/AlgR family response regulator
MRILIIEDEIPAAKQLKKLLVQALPEIEILDVLDSVERAVSWLVAPPILPEIIFMDIQLADGLSFDIFNQVHIKSPVIFTTAFDQYTLKAFKVNSIDYLLKPIDPEALNAALQKHQAFYLPPEDYNYAHLLKAIQQQTPKYKQRFLIKTGQELRFINTSDIHYFHSEEGIVFAQLVSKFRYNIDFTLDQLEELLDPASFFRINRKLIVCLKSIQKIHTYFNSRLKLDLRPLPNFEVIVSRDRVPGFKLWLDS